MSDPIAKFKEWLGDAVRHTGIIEPTAMCLATADKDGQPSARMVLLKAVDKSGFIFYSNLESRKGAELKQNPKAALCFYWMSLFRQVRVEGTVEEVSAAEADDYFATRPRDSRIGAWASKQSSPLSDHETLVREMEEYTEKFEGKDVPRPPYWSGWRVIPDSIEFWQQGDFRLHDREVYTRAGQGWKMTRLYP